MKCTLSTVKYMLMAINIVNVLFAIGVIVVNVLAVRYFQNEGKAVAYLLITSASIVFAIALCGCCGTVNESSVCMWTYVVFLLIIAIVNFIALCGFLGSIENEEGAHKSVEDAWKDYQDGNERPITTMQRNYHCCGKNGKEDYTNNGKPIPLSCYDQRKRYKLYEKGCYEVVETHYANQEIWVKGITWTASIIECIAIVLGSILAINFPSGGSRESF